MRNSIHSPTGLLRQQVLERCPLRRKDQINDLSKQASQKSLITF